MICNSNKVDHLDQGLISRDLWTILLDQSLDRDWTERTQSIYGETIATPPQ